MGASAYGSKGKAEAVVPASETRVLAGDVPEGALANMLVGRAVVHVDLEGTPSVGERYDITLSLTLDDETPSVIKEKALLMCVEFLD